MQRAIYPLRYLIFLLVLLIPLRNIVEKVPNLGIDGLNITNLLFATIFILMFFDHRVKTSINNIKPSLKIPIILFLIYSFLTIFLTDPAINNVSNMLKFWKDIAFNMSLYFIAVKCLRTKKDIIICLLIMAFANIYMDAYFWRWVRWVNFNEFADKMKSVNGTFGKIAGANEWAAFFSTYTFLSFAIAQNTQNFNVRWCMYILSFINILVMLFSFSRGAYAAFVVGLIVYSMVDKKYYLIVVLIIIGLSYTIVLPSAVIDRIEMSFEKGDADKIEDQDIQSRIMMWNFSIQKIIESPIIGNGFMSFIYYEWRNPHNQHLNTLYQYGVIGYLIFIWIFIAAFLNAKRLYKRSEIKSNDKAIGLGLMAASVSLLTGNFFGDRWSYLPLTGYFWLLNGMAYKLITIYNKN